MADDVKEEDGEKKSLCKKKYGFRLTPEEQELAYELKAGMMRKLEAQNAQLKTELDVQKRMRERIKEDKMLATPKKYENLSHTNAIKLVKLYEKKNREGFERLQQLEKELEEATQLARRYRNMYRTEKSGVGTSRTDDRSSSPTSSRYQDTGRGDKVTEDDLDDDEAVFKRHVARLAATQSMLTTSPIRVQDIIRKNEVILNENDLLKQEVFRLKEDNANLVFITKHANADKDKLLHLITASESNRRDLTKRLEKEQKKHRTLHTSITRQASDWVHSRKDDQRREDYARWMNMHRMDVLASEDRTYSHQPKKNVYLPRKMHPVEQYAKS